MTPIYANLNKLPIFFKISIKQRLCGKKIFNHRFFLHYAQKDTDEKREKVKYIKCKVQTINYQSKRIFFYKNKLFSYISSFDINKKKAAT